MQPFQLRSERLEDRLRDDDALPSHIPVSDTTTSSASPVFGAVLSFASVIMLAFILRLAVPEEEDSVDLSVLLIAIGFAQIWLIFVMLKSMRK